MQPLSTPRRNTCGPSADVLCALVGVAAGTGLIDNVQKAAASLLLLGAALVCLQQQARVSALCLRRSKHRTKCGCPDCLVAPAAATEKFDIKGAISSWVALLGAMALLRTLMPLSEVAGAAIFALHSLVITVTASRSRASG